jgi:ParB family chromosome partitioning protein
MDKPKVKKRAGSTPKKSKKLALGRGLDALIPDIGPIENGIKEYFECDIELIRPNRYQPRLKFSKNELVELTRSIEKQGIIQPLVVRKDDNGYELITGERRLRAAKEAGFNRVPVVIKPVSGADLLEMSIIENVQREDLNPMEEAEAYHRLMTEFGLTQEQAAERVGKSRSAIANLLRLRQLPEQIKTSILEGILSMGHARALLSIASLAQQNATFRTVVSKGLSVRETENLIKRIKGEKKKAKHASTGSEKRHFLSLSDDLSRHFGTKVQIKRRGQKGTVVFEFYNNDDLDRLLNLLKHTP